MESSLKYLLLLALGFLHTTDGQTYRCDYKYCKFSQAWFKYHVVPAIWTDARLMCTLEGGILASPTTREIRATMTKSTGYTPIFTGLHATVSRGKYFTVDGIPLEEMRHGWAENVELPEYHKGGCLAMDSQGLFVDVDCYKPRPYMCYRNSAVEPNECGTTDSGYILDSRTNKCYKFHTVPRNFSRANFACSAEGGHLAIINGEKEVKIVKELFVLNPASKMVGNFWKDNAFIGFHDWGEHGEWRTIHGQTLEEAGYSRFQVGEPNNLTAGEYCGGIYRSGQLNDLWCGKRYAFICEKRPDFPPLCNIDGPSIQDQGLEEQVQSERRVDQHVSRGYSQFV